MGNVDHDGRWIGPQIFSNLDLGWVKSMPGGFGEFTVNIGLGINFLAFGTPFVTLRDTLTYGRTTSNLQIE